jgi:hypothetical protein
MRKILIFACFIFLFSCTQQSPGPPVPESSPVAAPADPLPSWNDVDSKKAITEFVMKVTKAGSPDFIPVEDRIACFDNDGTLWSEQPMYFQLICALDLVKAAAPFHPEWKTKEPFASILKGDLKKAMAGGEKSLLQIVMATQAGMSTDEFDQLVKEWLTTSKHPRFNRPYNEMVYQPMLELLAYLRANEFKTFIVSGGEEGFMCAWAGKTYNIPCEQTIGTTLKSEYHVKNDTPQIMRIPALNAMNDGKGKPVGIYEQIGKRPVFTAGNSDGDYEMLQWTTTATGYPGFGMIVHHTDSLREWAYDRGSHIGKLDRGLDDAAKYKWQIVDMKADWKVIFPFD